MKILAYVIFAIVFTILGIGGGMFASSQKSEAPAHGDAHDAHRAEPDAHAGHDHGPAKPTISPQALKNLGVSVADAETTTYVKYRAVAAVVMEPPSNTLPVFAPVGGRVRSINVLPDTIVASNTVVVELIRDPLPRPTLTMTEDTLKTSNEELHHSAAELRKAVRNVEITKGEIDRITKIAQSSKDDLPILPKKNLIDLQYELRRAEQDVLNAKVELRQHGFSEEQLSQVEAGQPLPVQGPTLWKQALQRNGLWPASAETLFQALPENVRALPLNVAVTSELASGGFASDELAQWLKEHADAAKQFPAIAGLLQQGHSLSAIDILNSQMAFSSIVQVRVPAAKGGEDWDVHEVLVKPGEKVEPGTKLLMLENSRQMLLKSEPLGGETAAVLKSLSEDAELEAMPLVAEAAPTLTKLKIAFVEGEPQSSGVVAFIRVANEPFKIKDDKEYGKSRSWKLRVGQKYILKIPTEKLENVFVVPSDALADAGPDKVVFIQNGSSFKPVKVEILHQDHAVAVIANNKDTELFPGDPVVQHNAFGLSLSLKAGAGEEGGHHHHHH